MHDEREQAIEQTVEFFSGFLFAGTNKDLFQLDQNQIIKDLQSVLGRDFNSFVQGSNTHEVFVERIIGHLEGFEIAHLHGEEWVTFNRLWQSLEATEATTVYVNQNVALGGIDSQQALKRGILTPDQIAEQLAGFSSGIESALGSVEVKFYEASELFEKVKATEGHVIVLENPTSRTRAQAILDLGPRVDLLLVPYAQETPHGRWIHPSQASVLGALIGNLAHPLVASRVKASPEMARQLSRLKEEDLLAAAA
jgi:hypothetical protein